ncbi:hypothetical protein [Bacillus wiedmannii]|uniref:Uncharacterized protein n=1 Tax=Bacillus wiedmannii TaxID=1890302 RepID=A0ABD6TLH4_9BACI|nr:hypothetical protein [Bacillus wiedmannii]PEO53490.1 hypothetical protein CN560_28980 [Bacillus wiedmannii]PEP09859.1 hypothetical protein CN552_22130 [Bacillus wiedmannii]PGC71924.1 hypothetical protein COM25_25655 [Bacillus wiedmannii]PHG13510.1 hypothetical protein COI74_28975 [Bacillus wiedmannii]
MKTNIDVMALAKEIESKNREANLIDVEEFIERINGQSMTPGDIIQKIVAPLIGIKLSHQNQFTIELLQKVVDEINSEKELV